MMMSRRVVMVVVLLFSALVLLFGSRLDIRSSILSNLADQVHSRGPAAHKLQGQATLNLGNRCYGSLVSFRGEIVYLTAAHCLRTCDEGQGKTQAGTLRFPRYFEGHVDEAPDCDGLHGGWDGGYGFIDGAPDDLSFENTAVVIDPDLDLAYVRGLFPQGLPEGLTALELAAESPPKGEPVFSLHWEPHYWFVEEAGGAVGKTGELLKPELGLSLGRPSWQSNFYSYYFASGNGDSGRAVVNPAGELVGVHSTGNEDKRVEIRTRAVCVEAIRMYLEKTWDNRK